jgi:DNA-binding NarL/FixJ family response regulator
VTALATRRLGDRGSDAQTRLVHASGPPLARLRIAQALAGSDLTTDFDSPVGDDTSPRSGVRQLVAYCASISQQQLERFSELKRHAPDLLIVAVCETADRRAVRRLLDAGIDGVVFADQLEEALEPTVAAVFAGQVVVPRDLRYSVDKPSLSSRERQILALVVTGLTNQEIAARMFLAESTVKSHLSSAYNKLGVRSRSEAVTVILERPDSLVTWIAAVAPKFELRAA